MGSPDLSVENEPAGPVLRHGPTSHGYATASFDSTEVYRYRLVRAWDSSLPRLAFCMLNPSTADERILDPTVRRCWGYAKSWGAGSLEVVNAYALRSTDPRALKATADPVGRPGNDEAILSAAKAADLMIVAWGAHATHLGREAEVLALLRGEGIPVACLRMTKAGHPGHPLYMPADLQPQWLPSAA